MEYPGNNQLINSKADKEGAQVNATVEIKTVNFCRTPTATSKNIASSAAKQNAWVMEKRAHYTLNRKTGPSAEGIKGEFLIPDI